MVVLLIKKNKITEPEQLKTNYVSVSSQPEREGRRDQKSGPIWRSFLSLQHYFFHWYEDSSSYQYVLSLLLHPAVVVFLYERGIKRSKPPPFPPPGAKRVRPGAAVPRPLRTEEELAAKALKNPDKNNPALRTIVIRNRAGHSWPCGPLPTVRTGDEQE